MIVWISKEAMRLTIKGNTMTPEQLQLPPTEAEVAELINAVQPVSSIRDMVRRLAFQRDKLEIKVERQRMTVSQSDLISAAYKLARMTERWSVSDLPEPWQESVQRLVDTVDALDKAKQVERTCPSCGLERRERGYCGCPDRDEC